MTGRIVHIDKTRGFGFLISYDSRNIYFKLRNSQYDLRKNDFVKFETIETPKGIEAVTLRKVYISKEGIFFFPRINKHHIHLDTDKYLKEIINNTHFDPEKEIIEIEYEFTDFIGDTYCVPASPEDEIIYAVRKGRKGHSKFILNKNPKECKTVTAIFKKVEDGYMIVTIYIGRKAAREPWDKRATQNDVDFWNDHALIFEKEKIIPGTETSFNPWILNEESVCKVNWHDLIQRERQTRPYVMSEV